MCGICGLALAEPNGPVEADLIGRMASILAHRGPDSHGFYQAPGIGLGVRRLAINDLKTGDQPISNADGTITLICNGEIYNFRELRSELLAAGHTFRSTSDVEVIVHLYEDEGTDCLRRLRGMFAFALWDAHRRRLMLARDRLGIKPLFYALDEQGCIFGSENKAILAAERVTRRIDPLAFRDVFTWGFVRGPKTLLADIRQLLPGHYLLYRDGRASLHRYWDLTFAPRGEDDLRSTKGWIEAFRSKLDETLALHLRSDVPFGAWLSPGIDSSSIASLTSALVPGSLRTFSLGFENPDVDELARWRTLDHFPGYQLQGERVVCKTTDIERLPLAIWHGEDMLGNSILIPRMLLSAAAGREHKVVLSGEGADELLGGYPWFGLDRLLRPLAGLPLGVRRAMLLGPLLPRRWPWASQLLVGPSELNLDRFRRLIGLAHTEVVERLFSSDLRRLVEAEEAESILDRPADFDRWHPFAQLQYFELKVRLPDRILYSVDRASMAYGLEARVPFLDHELVELCARMPPSTKLRGRQEKYALREAMRGRLPAEILQRRKRGLTAPTADWLRSLPAEFAATLLTPEAIRDKGYFAPAVVEALFRQHQAGVPRYADYLFAVLATQLWDDMFVRGRHSAWVPLDHPVPV